MRHHGAGDHANGKGGQGKEITCYRNQVVHATDSKKSLVGVNMRPVCAAEIWVRRGWCAVRDRLNAAVGKHGKLTVEINNETSCI